MRWALWLAALVTGTGTAACQDYRLKGKDQVAESEETAAYGTPEWDCEPLETQIAEPVDDALTCFAVEVETWDLVSEARIELAAGTPYLSAPVVAPMEVGGPPTIFVLDGRGSSLVAIDARSGAWGVVESIVNDIEFFSWGFPAAGGERILAILNTVDDGLDVSRSPGSWSHLSASASSAPLLGDIDQDGSPEVLWGGGAVNLDGRMVRSWPTSSHSLWDLLFLAHPGAELSIVNGEGHYALDGTELAVWPAGGRTSYMGYMQAYPLLSDKGAGYVAVDGLGPFGVDDDGELLWSGVDGAGRKPPGETGYVSALGDTDGDGVADLCLLVGDRVVVMSGDGRVLLDDRTGSPDAWKAGGCALADLDADGNHEVVAFSMFGLRLYDVESGTLLAERDDICTAGWETPPIIADVDLDDSAEIIVSGGTGPCSADALGADGSVFILGPRNGRWARTRPVWNQLAYDPTSVSDDGRVLSVPPSNPRTLHGYRAQPANDGAYANLVPEAVDACASTCNDGVILLSVRVKNLGTVDAPPGARVTLYTRSEGAPFDSVATAVSDASIPSGWASDTLILEVPHSEWGEERVLDVDNGGAAECNLLDNRLTDGIPDPCAP